DARRPAQGARHVRARTPGPHLAHRARLRGQRAALPQPGAGACGRRRGVRGSRMERGPREGTLRLAVRVRRGTRPALTPACTPGATRMTATPNPARGLHHFAWRCRDAEETRHFYEDVLGMPLMHVIRLDHVPSTGEYCPYVHLFFEM